MIKDISFKNNKGQTLMGVLYVPENKRRRKFPAVIVCHGLAGSKDADNKVSLADALFKEGFVVMRFDFSGHGKSEGSFGDLTLTQEVNDAQAAVDALYSLDAVDKAKVGIAGHSLGGAVVIIESAKDRRVKSAVSIAGVIDMIRPLSYEVGTHYVRDWQKLGEIEVEPAMRLKHQFIIDFQKNNVLGHAKKIKIPFLVIHGRKDVTVGLNQAKAIASAAHAQLTVVDEAHDFGAESIAAAVGWFNRTLKR